MRLPSFVVFRRTAVACAIAAFLLCPRPLGADVRLKDIVTLQGISPLPLLGYGLVVGLDKTGDRKQTIFSTQTLANMLQRLGVTVPGDQLKVENVAAVLVTGELPPFARRGARLDVTASSIGDARSLQGGTLLATALHGPNGDVVALAQGPLSIGGFGGGGSLSSVQVNHLSVGRIPGGGMVETDSGVTLPGGDSLTLSLNAPDFVTATRIARAINNELGGAPAKAVDPGTIALAVPGAYKGSIPELMARLEMLTVATDTSAKVVINERTGTVVIGGNVRLGPAAVAHGNLSVRITTRLDVSQAAPMAPGGQTVVVPNERVDIREGTARLVSLEEGTTLDLVTRSLNALGASPRDIIAIMQALKAAGALQAEIVIL